MAPSSVTTSLLVSTAAVTAVGCCWTLLWKNHRQHQRDATERRRQRAQRVDEEKEKDEHEEETLPSILEHFRELHLGNDCTIAEANQRRTVKYYELARDAHVYDLCVGVRSYTRLRNRREAELGRIMKYHMYNLRHGPQQRKSHRTVMVMVDDFTGRLLHQAREKILEPLNYTSDITTSSRVWIPEESIIPTRDMHVTVAIPWWWHTVREGNQQLSEELVARFRQALVMEFHHPFQLELERIVLLGGKTLMALWRCVGERKTIDGDVIHDRHGEGHDPFVKLRRDIVRCFTATDEFESFGKEPLTYSHRFQQQQQPQPQSSEQSTTPSQATTAATTTTTLPLRGMLKRENSIELKTPGLRYVTIRNPVYQMFKHVVQIPLTDWMFLLCCFHCSQRPRRLHSHDAGPFTTQLPEH